MIAVARIPDIAPLGAPSGPPADGSGFARALDALGATLERAERAEDHFAAGRASLQDAVYARARADVALAVATAAAGKAAQALQSILDMAI